MSPYSMELWCSKRNKVIQRVVWNPKNLLHRYSVFCVNKIVASEAGMNSEHGDLLFAPTSSSFAGISIGTSSIFNSTRSNLSTSALVKEHETSGSRLFGILVVSRLIRCF